MYSDKKNILQLVALLKAHGVRKIVLCPGSRNAAIVHTLANIEDFTCYSVTDERSAGFFCHRPIFTRGRPCRSMLHFRFGPAEPAPCRSRSLLPTSTSDCHFRRPPRCLDRTNGRTNPAPAPCVRNVSQDVCQPARSTY